MNQDIAIKVENISKKYVVGEKNNFVTLRDRLASLPRDMFTKKKPKEFWALKNISFEVRRGEILGVIGRNGAGKSTLLKILSRITEPTTGQVTMKGRVASLLEVGTGFNPELTGRENIFLNGAIIGMSRKEIKQKFDSIVEFADIGKFLDTPVKRYSSGMYVRLAFAVAAHLDSDILLVDEVLAVGDLEFQKKSFGKMNNLAEKGKTVIFISHSIPAVSKLCTHSLWIESGKIAKSGDTQKVINSYINSTLDKANKKVSQRLVSTCGRFSMKIPKWINERGEEVEYYKYGMSPMLEINMDFKKTVKNLCLGFAILNLNNERILTSHHIDDKNNDLPTIFKNKMKIIFNLDLKTLSPGIYRIIIGVKDQTNKVLIYSEDYAPLEIRPSHDGIDGAMGFLWHTGHWHLA